MARVLLAFAEPSIRETLRGALASAGYEVVERASGADAIATVRQSFHDVVVGEIDMPGVAAFELVREIASLGPTRVIVASARAAEVDRVVAFELGADDYVTLPVSARELVLRVGAILRGRAEERPVERLGDLEIDRGAARVLRGGIELPLTRGELSVLLDLLDARGGVRTRAQLLRETLGDDGKTSERAVDTHVKRLRAKLGASAYLIETVLGVGYRLGAPRAT